MSIYKSPICSCIVCQKQISTNRLVKHYKSKKCLKSIEPKHIPKCEHCGIELTNFSWSKIANHVRWCKLNPKYSSYINDLKTRNHNISEEKCIEIGLKISLAHKEGKYKLVPQKSLETKKINGTLKPSPQALINMTEANRNAKHQRVCKSTHEYIDKHGRIFKFDSSWEDILADRLDHLDILWTRPDPIPYFIEEKLKHYYADFYLPEYDIYIDPKNSYVESQQKEKLIIISSMITLIILRSAHECKYFTP